MHNKRVRLSDTVFSLNSTMELPWGVNTEKFAADDGEDVRIGVRFAMPGEQTPQANGYAMIQREGERFEIALPVLFFPQPTVRQVMTLLPLSELLLNRGTLTMHASFVLYRDEAILFSGPSGIGKSTQAELWRRHRDAWVVNGDRVFLTRKDGRIMVSGHFFCGTSGICENATAPLKAIVMLEQTQKNGIIHASTLEKFRSVMSQLDYQVNDRIQVTQVTALVEQIMRCSPVYRYGCRVDEDAVTTLENILYN